MRRPRTGPPGPAMANLLLGIAQLARGRKDGLRQFGNSPQAVLAALTPLVAFMIVGGFVALLGGDGEAIGDIAAVAIGLLGPLVLSFEVARRWGRAANWPRFAAAFLWCQWAAPVVLAGVLVLVATLMAGGLDGESAAVIGVTLLFGYGLWLHWFLACHALELTALRAVALVAIVNAATMALIILPQAADYVLNGAPPS